MVKLLREPLFVKAVALALSALGGYLAAQYPGEWTAFCGGGYDPRG